MLYLLLDIKIYYPGKLWLNVGIKWHKINYYLRYIYKIMINDISGDIWYPIVLVIGAIESNT